MKKVECMVDGIMYRRYKAESYIDCIGCAGRHDKNLCTKLGGCGTFDEDGWEDYIWKKVEKYVDTKHKK